MIMGKQPYLCLMSQHVIMLGRLERKESNANHFISSLVQFFSFFFFIGFVATVYARNICMAFSFEGSFEEILLLFMKNVW